MEYFLSDHQKDDFSHPLKCGIRADPFSTIWTGINLVIIPETWKPYSDSWEEVMENKTAFDILYLIECHA